MTEELHAINSELADKVKVFFSGYKTLKAAVATALATNTAVPPKNEILNLFDEIKKVTDDLEAQAKQYDNADKPEEFKKLSDAKTHLVISATNITDEDHPEGWFFTNTGNHKETDGENGLSDDQISLVDIALATSAAPCYFPTARIHP